MLDATNFSSNTLVRCSKGLPSPKTPSGHHTRHRVTGFNPSEQNLLRKDLDRGKLSGNIPAAFGTRERSTGSNIGGGKWEGAPFGQGQYCVDESMRGIET